MGATLSISNAVLCFVLLLCSALHTLRHIGYAGSALLHHPIENSEQFETFDMQFRRACCGLGDNFTEFCDLFFDQRLINTGENYEPPRLGK